MAVAGIPRNRIPKYGAPASKSQAAAGPRIQRTPPGPANDPGYVDPSLRSKIAQAPNPNGVGSKPPVADYQNNPEYKRLNQQRAQTLAEIQRRGGISKTPNFATKLNDLNTQIRGMRKGVPGTGGPVTVENGPAPAVTPEAPVAPMTPDTSAADAAKALYPGLGYQLPENYQGSPMYKFQMEQGTTALNRKLAQRGLLDSGAELEATNKLSSEVGAQESQRLMDQAQTEADRYERVSANEANRLQTSEQQNWNRRMDILNALTKQSPMNEAYAGANKYSDISMGRGKAKASNTASNYKKVSGGGRQSVAPFAPPAASGPDYSQAELMKALFGNSNSRQTGSTIDSFIGSLFG